MYTRGIQAVSSRNQRERLTTTTIVTTTFSSSHYLTYEVVTYLICVEKVMYMCTVEGNGMS